MSKYAGGKGEENINWKGGVADYPNHSEMKRNRLIKLKEANGKCEACEEEAFCVHHLDGSVDNHSLDNLAVLCKKCHYILHAGRNEENFSVRRKTSKYIREYGMTLKGIANKYGGTGAAYRYMHLKGELHQFIEDQEKEKVGGINGGK